MKTKAFILTASIALCLFAFSGCTSNTDTTTDTGLNDKYRSGYNGANTALQNENNMNWGSVTDGSLESENNIINNYAAGKYGISEDLYSRVVDIEGVNDCRVYIKGNEAYCAVKTDNGKELSTTYKNKLSKLIREEYSDVNKVYFSYDEDALQKLGDYLRNGIDDMDTTLKNMFR